MSDQKQLGRAIVHIIVMHLGVYFASITEHCKRLSSPSDFRGKLKSHAEKEILEVREELRQYRENSKQCEDALEEAEKRLEDAKARKRGSDSSIPQAPFVEFAVAIRNVRVQ